MAPKLFAVLAFALAACSTPPTGIRPFTAGQRGAFLKRAKPPEAFGLTSYRTDDGPIFAGAHRLHHGQTAVLPFAGTEEDAPPMVDLSILGVKKPIRALVDTTSRDNWAVPELVPLMRGVPIGPPGVGRTADHVLDDVGGILFIAPKIVLDEAQVESALFYARAAFGPLGPPARWVAEPEPQAVLGATLLRAFPLCQLDLPRQRIVLATSQDYTPDEGRLLATLPLLDEKGAMACLATLDGKPGKVLLDIAGDFEMAVNDPIAAAVTQLTLGDLVLRHVPVQNGHDLGLGLPDNPRLGRRLLQRFVITIDTRRKLVYFERPAN